MLARVPDAVPVGANAASDAEPCDATMSNKRSALHECKGVDSAHMSWAPPSARPPAASRNMTHGKPQSHHIKEQHGNKTITISVAMCYVEMSAKWKVAIVIIYHTITNVGITT